MSESLRKNLTYTAVVYYLFLQLALRYGLCGPTLSDLKDNLNETLDGVSKSISIMSVGICIGAISSGFICKYFTRELISFVLVLLTALLVASIAFLKLFSLFLVWNFLVGVTSGAAISICESLILEIWGSKCGPYMQALQFFRGLGYIIAPLLANPFLAPTPEEGSEEAVKDSTESIIGSNSTTNINSTTYNGNITMPFHDLHDPYNHKIRTPFILNAGMLALGAALLFGMYFYRRLSSRIPSKGISQMDIMSVSSAVSNADSKLSITTKEVKSVQIDKRSKYFSYAIILLSSVFYLFFYEEAIVIFLPTFAENLQVKLSKNASSLLTTAFSLSNLVGKVVGVVLALKISYIIILYVHISIMIGSLVLIILFANTHVTILWIGVCIHGFGLSSIIASLYTLLESSVEMSPSICGILNMMGTAGSVIMPLIIGNHLETFPMALMYACWVSAVVCLVLYVVMHVLLMNKDKIIAKMDKSDVPNSYLPDYEHRNKSSF